MKKLWLIGVAFTVLAAGPAMAAERPVKAPVSSAPPPVPVYSWTGCYIGGQGGGGWGRETASAPALAPGASVSGRTSGFLRGGQAGCNYQFAPNWVIGIEADGSGDIRGDQTATVLGITGTAQARTDWIVSVTGRLGWSWNTVLLYAKGGAAWAGNKYFADIPNFAEHLEASETRTGWTVGGGIEWGFFNNWSAKLEYDFYNFGTRTLTFTGTFAGLPNVVPGIEIKQTISVVKFGLNYRFGSSPNSAAY
jgi:opacity protein-like surface antigen